jgi:hypothetical protein
MTFEQVLSVIADPEVPVVWLEPGLPVEFWRRVQEETSRTGYRVFRLDSPAPPASHDELLAAFCAAAAIPREECPNLNALKDALLGLSENAAKGWVILFKEAGLLRQADEATFEDLLDIVGLVADIKLKKKGKVFKLVVED